jgi:hypothetical protein
MFTYRFPHLNDIPGTESLSLWTLLMPNEQTTMGTSIDNVLSSVQGLTLGNDPYSTRNQLTSLQEAI